MDVEDEVDNLLGEGTAPEGTATAEGADPQVRAAMAAAAIEDVVG